MKRASFFLTVVLSAAFVLGFYHKILFNPDDYFFTSEGDAVKNYFTYAYHIKYDDKLTVFSGMNYPYGELFIYTDCHPALTAIFKISGCSFFVDHSIGILNFLMIISIFLTFIVMWFLLKEFGINEWIAVLFSLSITILAPQIFRLSGHFALSYSFAIPLSLLLILRAMRIRKYFLPLTAILFLGLFWIFIHAYLAIIIAFMLFCVISGTLITDRTRRSGIVRYLTAYLVILIPVIVFYIFSSKADTHTGRMEGAGGFFLYNAEADDIFVANHPPLRPFLDLITGNAINQKWEAWSYVGLSTSVLFIYLLGLSLLKLFRKKGSSKLLNSIFSSRKMNIALISSVIVLMYAMAFPFKQFPAILDIFPVIKSFRTTGRFTWPFYFMAGIFAAWTFQQLWLYYKDIPRKKNAIMILLICAGVAGIIEGIPYHSETSAMVTRTPDYFRTDHLPKDWVRGFEKINPADYQAILPLPYYHLGSETYTRLGSSRTSLLSMAASYHTGIPLMSSALARTSIPESRSLIQLISPDYYAKELRGHLPSGKPVLVIGAGDPLSEHETGLLSKCRLLFSGDGIKIFSLDTADLFRSSASTVYSEFERKRSSMIERSGFLASDSSSFLYHEGFEDRPSVTRFSGNGGLTSQKNEYNTFAVFEPGTFKTGKDYAVSAWMYNGTKNALNEWLRFIVAESPDNVKYTETATFFPEQSEVINGNWSLSEGTFRISDPQNWVRVYTIGKKDNEQQICIDDFMIREAGLDVYKLNKAGDSLFFNNQLIIRPGK